MHLPKVTPFYSAPRYSARFQELQAWFRNHQPPYSLQDVATFNAIYQRDYRLLKPEEKRRADELVDAVIEGAGRKEWEARVFGVNLTGSACSCHR